MSAAGRNPLESFTRPFPQNLWLTALVFIFSFTAANLEIGDLWSKWKQLFLAVDGVWLQPYAVSLRPGVSQLCNKYWCSPPNSFGSSLEPPAGSQAQSDGDTAMATEPSCRAQGTTATGRIQRCPQPAWGYGHLCPRASVAFPSWDTAWQQLAAAGQDRRWMLWMDDSELPLGQPRLGADPLGCGCFLPSGTYRHVPMAVCFCTHGCACTYTIKHGLCTGQPCFQPPCTNHQKKLGLGEPRNHGNTQGLVEVFLKGWRFSYFTYEFWEQNKIFYYIF